MQLKLLKDLVENIAGKPASEIVDQLVGKKDVNEFLIAKKLKLTINQARNILYKLSDRGLVSFIRKKDKRKGWYIYFWTLNALKSLELLEKKVLEELGHLENLLKSRKTKRFYFCETCNIEIGEETALLNEFSCPECGQVYILSQNDRAIKEIENEISKVRKQMETIKEEREKEQEKEGKKSRRKIQKAERDKKKQRKETRTANKKAREKIKRAEIRKEKKSKNKIKKSKKSSKKKIKKKKKK